MSAYFYFSVLVLALLLLFPTTKMIWVLSVRRLQRKMARVLTQEEITGQKRRARFIAVPIVIIFSWLFNTQLLGITHG